MKTSEAIEILECGEPNFADYNTVGDYDDAVLRYRRAKTHAIEVMRLSEWQPIETAPKDGTLVLVAHPVTMRSDTDQIVRVAWMKDGLWASHPSCWLVNEHMPTHWMPLPPAPEGGE